MPSLAFAGDVVPSWIGDYDPNKFCFRPHPSDWGTNIPIFVTDEMQVARVIALKEEFKLLTKKYETSNICCNCGQHAFMTASEIERYDVLKELLKNV